MKDQVKRILTISIAAYNVEKYINRTLSSLNDPRFLDDIEVLIIDDGSSDNTKRIALEFEASAPDTFHYIRKENGGHGSTINCGIRLATGKYFRVIDGDDWVDTESFALYIERLKCTDADMIITPMKTCCNGKEIIDDYSDGMDDGKVYTWDDRINIRMITIHTMTLCTDLLKKNDVRITEKCFYVDVEYVAWGIYLSETIASINMPTYVYRMGNEEQSVSLNNRLKNIDMQENISYQLARLYEQFKRSGKLQDKQNLLLFDRISISIYWTVRTYMIFPDRNESKLRIMTFENNIRRLSPSLFQMMGTKKLFKLLRLSHYKCIPVLRRVYQSNLFSK